MPYALRRLYRLGLDLDLDRDLDLLRLGLGEDNDANLASVNASLPPFNKRGAKIIGIVVYVPPRSFIGLLVPALNSARDT